MLNRCDRSNWTSILNMKFWSMQEFKEKWQTFGLASRTPIQRNFRISVQQPNKISTHRRGKWANCKSIEWENTYIGISISPPSAPSHSPRMTLITPPTFRAFRFIFQQLVSGSTTNACPVPSISHVCLSVSRSKRGRELSNNNKRFGKAPCRRICSLLCMI